MEYAEWLEMEREILARVRAAFTGERPLAGWEIDGRKHVGNVDVYAVWTEEQKRRLSEIAELFTRDTIAIIKAEEDARETH